MTSNFLIAAGANVAEIDKIIRIHPLGLLFMFGGLALFVYGLHLATKPTKRKGFGD